MFACFLECQIIFYFVFFLPIVFCPRQAGKLLVDHFDPFELCWGRSRVAFTSKTVEPYHWSGVSGLSTGWPSDQQTPVWLVGAQMSFHFVWALAIVQLAHPKSFLKSQNNKPNQTQKVKFYPCRGNLACLELLRRRMLISLDRLFKGHFYMTPFSSYRLTLEPTLLLRHSSAILGSTFRGWVNLSFA